MYDVMLKGSVVGSVVLRRQGAYYLLECNCGVHMTQRYHLMLIMNDKETDLGVCLPNKTGLELRTRIKVSEMGDSIPIFALADRDDKDNECTFAVKTDEPFAKVSRIQYGRLNIQNGTYGITFELADLSRSPIQQGSDPSQEHPSI